MKNTTTKKASAKKKLLPAAGSLLISAAMLSTSTYAWFTMNKEVKVTGMEVKAHAEEGLLINEVKAHADTNWDDQATAGTNLIALRPASTSNLTNWWHANSKISAEEAGIGELDTNTVEVATGKYYTNVSASNTDAISDKAIVQAEDGTTEGVDKATGATRAETHVYYKDASFGAASQYDDGEGFYVKYTYYLKSSGDRGLTISDLKAAVKATHKTTSPDGDTENLMKSLRVGIEVPTSSSDATRAGLGIFAPVNGADDTYNVTNVDTGATYDSVDPVDATTTGAFTDLTTLNITPSGGTAKTVTIPDNNSDGIPVYVYVWFEGEDNNCNSDNLQTVLSTYDIDVKFSIGDAVY